MPITEPGEVSLIEVCLNLGGRTCIAPMLVGLPPVKKREVIELVLMSPIWELQSLGLAICRCRQVWVEVVRVEVNVFVLTRKLDCILGLFF